MTMTDEGTGGAPPPKTPKAQAGDLGDLPETAANPVIMLDAYVEIGAANLSCLGMEVSIEPENKPIELTTFCGVFDYPGPVKWHFKAKLAQSFDPEGTDATLQAALDAFAASGAVVPFKVRPYKSRPISATNPSIEGNAIPQPYAIFGGAAGNVSEVDIDWILDAPPSRNITPGP
jgi:hypothetical protein